MNLRRVGQAIAKSEPAEHLDDSVDCERGKPNETNPVSRFGFWLFDLP